MNGADIFNKLALRTEEVMQKPSMYTFLLLLLHILSFLWDQSTVPQIQSYCTRDPNIAQDKVLVFALKTLHIHRLPSFLAYHFPQIILFPPFSFDLHTDHLREHYDYVGYHMEKEAAKKQAVLATLARLEAPYSSTAPVRTLASEMRKRPSERTLVPPTV
jgi:hypothetical protein